MESLSPTPGRTAVALVLLVTSYAAIDGAVYMQFAVFASVVFVLSACVLALQAYGAYRAWTGRGEPSTGE
ncbi:hypothetical protein ACFPYI_04015 [Halomarina salina]|uniref:Uncharacterized protein n=1 Tax=Halomarina salina TaxID=1872699 RepID=A0ABD5RIT2_9EURY|nr:hypothetical protein [Halomarina salina]